MLSFAYYNNATNVCLDDYTGIVNFQNNSQLENKIPRVFPPIMSQTFIVFFSPMQYSEERDRREIYSKYAIITITVQCTYNNG